MSTLYAIRGATTVERDLPEEIGARVLELVERIAAENRIQKGETVSLIATSTVDIRSAYPVKFIRQSGILGEPAFFSALEPDVTGGLNRCIRVLLHIQKPAADFKPKHVYLHGATVLREDLK